MKVLALDYGSARTGVAVCDPSGTLARPLETIERIGGKEGAARLLTLLAEHEVELLLVGLPLMPDGTHGDQANATMAFVGRLRPQTAVPIASSSTDDACMVGWPATSIVMRPMAP